MRFAYADPPYPGQSKRLYGDHPDYAGEVDHEVLLGRLVTDYPDGWALSTSVEALRYVLLMCPQDVRVAVWNVTNRRPFAGRGRWHQSWEPVIVHRGRLDYHDELRMVRDLFSCGTSPGAVPGRKPTGFGRWVFDLLGALPGDGLDDLFPGSGGIGDEWAAFQRQDSLPLQYAHSRARGGQGWTSKDQPELGPEMAMRRSTSWRK